ncbi:transmembrane protein, putative (macronuclear) [Tetrahymena thermophila SB210]|uniref:Transmembrane protein, putative n=1 Tax=Tetrahymena thermophila (strain SB210) TaxID=312017 RepID=W7X574_TETTS|nr:transmembrane protein, putative [Tetrahymena thermophila SB210]EWS74515.1 transmembrane protein, putative [Tetrahymena thermophila SB210]|eukprot:XP_012652945.1 transmembrane protein, putative [Tetrahymena thermophila SB210]
MLSILILLFLTIIIIFYFLKQLKFFEKSLHLIQFLNSTNKQQLSKHLKVEKVINSFESN